ARFCCVDPAVAGARARAIQQRIERPRHQTGALHGADWRVDAQRARGDCVCHQPAGSPPVEVTRLPAEDCRVAAERHPEIPAGPEEDPDGRLELTAARTTPAAVRRYNDLMQVPPSTPIIVRV